MEFKEFCKEVQRICDYHLYDKGCCGECPLNPFTNDKIRCLENVIYYPDESERIVGEWAKEHPLITNGDKFKEVFGLDINITDGGTLHIDTRNYISWLKSEYKTPQKNNK